MAYGVNHGGSGGYTNPNIFGRNTQNWGNFGNIGTPTPKVSQGQPFTINSNFAPQGGAGYAANDYGMNYGSNPKNSIDKRDNSFSWGDWGKLGVGALQVGLGFGQLDQNKKNAAINNQYKSLDLYNQSTAKNNIMRERQQFRQQALGNQLGSDANTLATNAYMDKNKLRTEIG